MEAEHKVGAVQLSARLRGVSPPVTRRLRVAEQTSLAELHAALQVAFGWSDGHLYTFQIRGWQFGDPARAIELALAGGGVDIPLAAFGFEIGEPFLYQYNLFIPWEIDCRIEARGLIGGRVLFLQKVAVSPMHCTIHDPKLLIRRDGQRSVRPGIGTCRGS
jgi:Plasmid pRiA4b ORF-3-like protein